MSVRVTHRICAIKPEVYHVSVISVIVPTPNGGIQPDVCRKVKTKNSIETTQKNIFHLGSNLDSCTTGQHYECEEYNFLSCIASQCQCGSTMYWSTASNTCLAKRSYMGTCASTNECLTSVSIGLSCVSGQCQCTGGQSWNSTHQQCY